MPSVLDRILGRKPQPEAIKSKEPNKVEEAMLKALASRLSSRTLERASTRKSISGL